MPVRRSTTHKKQRHSMTKTRVAALQMQGRLGDLNYNLDHIRELLDEAVHQKARVVAVPEFFTTPIIENPRLWAASLPTENPALDLLREYATDHNLLVGGSYLERRGTGKSADAYNCYTLVQPDGTFRPALSPISGRTDGSGADYRPYRQPAGPPPPPRRPRGHYRRPGVEARRALTGNARALLDSRARLALPVLLAAAELVWA